MCEHTDGWIITDCEVISLGGEWSNDNIIATLQCNHLDCKETKEVRLNIEVVE